MISRFEKCREGAEPKCRPEAGVESEVVLGFCAWDVSLRVVEPSTNNYVRLRVCAGKREYQIGEACHGTKVGPAWTADSSSMVREFVVDPVEPYSNWKLSDADGEDCDAVVASVLRFAQFAHRNSATSSNAERVSFLRQRRKGRQGADERDYQASKKLFHHSTRIVFDLLTELAGEPSERAI